MKQLLAVHWPVVIWSSCIYVRLSAVRGVECLSIGKGHIFFDKCVNLSWSTNWVLVNFLPPPFVILVVVAKLESSLFHDKFTSSCISSYSTACKELTTLLHWVIFQVLMHKVALFHLVR